MFSYFPVSPPEVGKQKSLPRKRGNRETRGARVVETDRPIIMCWDTHDYGTVNMVVVAVRLPDNQFAGGAVAHQNDVEALEGGVGPEAGLIEVSYGV